MIKDKGILIKNIYYMLTYAFQELRKTHTTKSQSRISRKPTTFSLKFLSKDCRHSLNKGCTAAMSYAVTR